MGEHKADESTTREQHHAFIRALLDDVRALERMIAEGLIEQGVRRIGAEQEIFLIDQSGEPAPRALDVLEQIDDPAFTTELASFNLEVNLPPQVLTADCLGRLETDLDRFIDKARHGAHACGADVFLTGILPTLKLSDLGIDNMTPVPRYYALNSAMKRQRGGRDFQVLIKGVDELFATHDNVMLESCNTSFQIHFQVWPDEFARLYNLAQAVTAPVLAAAVNSPLLLEKRLWNETRVALFQHSIDDRSSAHLRRGQTPRVSFGEAWVESVLDIFRDDIARFRVMLAADDVESSLAVLDRGEIPELKALRLHNGTVYRWNRPCYGVHDGKAHLRIENRALPAGPTVVDEVANAALFFGLMAQLAEEVGDITRVMDFDDALDNFWRAARHGLQAQMTWIDGQEATASELLLHTLVPQARKGLLQHGVDPDHVKRYLDVIEERVTSGMTGSRWAVRSLARMQGTVHERCRGVTTAALSRQKIGKPVHTWTLAESSEAPDWRHAYRTVGQFMTKHLFTCREDDLVDLSAHQMSTKRIRHIPVEDEQGRLVGLVTYRQLIRLLAEGRYGAAGNTSIGTVMVKDVVTVTPDTPTLDAIALMRKHHIGCLPVVEGNRLVGILTERDLVELSSQLFEEHLKGFPKA